MSARWHFQRRFLEASPFVSIHNPRAAIRDAVGELEHAALTNPLRAAEGAVLFLCGLPRAIDRLRSKTSHVPDEVERAITALVPLIARPAISIEHRQRWLSGLSGAAHHPTLYPLYEHWGTLCASEALASNDADERLAFRRQQATSLLPPDLEFQAGHSVVLAELFHARRYADLLALIDGSTTWFVTRWAARALLAQGHVDQAVERAEGSYSHDSAANRAIARFCEEALLSAGRAAEAYERFAASANRAPLRVDRVRAIARKYPHLKPADILRRLAQNDRAHATQWFTAAKTLGLRDAAVRVAAEARCDARTLITAARQWVKADPSAAMQAGLLALHASVVRGASVTETDVRTAWKVTFEAAQREAAMDMVLSRLRLLASQAPESHLARVVARDGFGGVP